MRQPDHRLDYLLTCLGLPFPPPLRALDIGTGHVAIYALLLRALRPDAAVYGSEIDAESLEHARGVLKHNRIPPVPETIAEASEATATASASVLAPDSAAGGVTLLPACPNGGLLTHPILPLSFTLCNPPFFSSESEVATSRASKPVGTSGPTCSINEEITRGGEAAFISQMIEESAREPLRDRVAWFTSLVGRYSTLEAVVTLVKRTTGNYAVVRLQQARTVRWVVVWSFGWDRLPDVSKSGLERRRLADAVCRR